MPIAPKPFMYKCPKCNYTKVVAPKSDVLNPTDMDSTCPKCGETMEIKPLNLIDALLSKL